MTASSEIVLLPNSARRSLRWCAMVVLIFVALGLALLSVLDGAQPKSLPHFACEEKKLTAADGAAGDKFGNSAAVSGRIVVVGARFHDDAGVDSGSAFVFRYENGQWVQQQELIGSDEAEGDSFGHDVAVSGPIIVVAAPWDDDAGSTSGSVYVFYHDGSAWQEQAKLTASDAAAGDNFGESVDVWGSVILVGSAKDNGIGNDSGAAYIFRFDGEQWIEEQKLTAHDAADGDNFGFSSSLQNGVAVVGSRYDDDAGPSSGSAYVFRYTGGGWSEEQKLTASDGGVNDGFGASVSVSGDIIAVGARFDDDRITDSGSVYVYRFAGSEWVEVQKLTQANASSGDAFGGRSVAVDGGLILVGAPGDDDGGNNAGAVFTFRLGGSTWVQDQKLVASGGNHGDLFGNSVSVSTDVAAIGARLDDDAGESSGSVYVFSWSASDADMDGVCDVRDTCSTTPPGTPVNACGCAGIGACCFVELPCQEALQRNDCSSLGGVYQGDGSICDSGCVNGDFDLDGDVDLEDLAFFERCFSPRAEPQDPDCARADVDGCGTIDLDDFRNFTSALTGP